MHSKHGLHDSLACARPSDIANNLHSDMMLYKNAQYKVRTLRSSPALALAHIVRRAWQHELVSCDYSGMSAI